MVSGEYFSVILVGAPGTDFDLYLYQPGTPSVAVTSSAVAVSAHAGSNELFSYRATAAGTYYLRVTTRDSDGAYQFVYGFPDKPATISLSAPTSIGYGGTATLSGTLRAGGGEVVAKRALVIEGLALGASNWTALGTRVTDSAGRYSFGVKPSIRTSYRARLIVDPVYVPSTSPVRAVTPKAYVGNPVAPTYARRNVAFTTYGYLKPRHTAGSACVRIYKYRYVSGRWRAYGYVNAKASNYSSYSKYAVSMRLPYAGRWRLRAYHGDSGHAATWSGYKYVTVR